MSDHPLRSSTPSDLGSQRHLADGPCFNDA
jgi:hypothetical protein